MTKLTIAMSLDDVHYQLNYGLERSLGNLKWIEWLHDNVGIKTTVFVVPKWHNQISLHPQLNRWLLDRSEYIEVACHGLTHKSIDTKFDSAEFANINSVQEAEKRLTEAKAIFKRSGFDVVGFKAPGWLIHPASRLAVHGLFNYYADHFIARKTIRVNTKCKRVPYLYELQKISPSVYSDGDLIVLHAHIGPDGSNDNNISEELCNKVKGFIDYLNKEGYELEFKFMRDL